MELYGYEITINNPPYVFGDGTHETTRFLLYFLNRYAEGKSYIDAGCGTGILSIFASKHEATSVTAIDIDDNAIDCARENAEANAVNMDVTKVDIRRHKACADLVTANFARHEALSLLSCVANFVKDGGLLATTWYKKLPKDALLAFEIIDHIEGVEYDCYVLKRMG